MSIFCASRLTSQKVIEMKKYFRRKLLNFDGDIQVHYRSCLSWIMLRFYRS